MPNSTYTSSQLALLFRATVRQLRQQAQHEGWRIYIGGWHIEVGELETVRFVVSYHASNAEGVQLFTEVL